MENDPRPPPLAADTAVLERSGTGWGVMEPGALALGPGACVGSGGPRRYEVRELLGRGAMGEVHLAFDERVGRDVALKVLSTEGGSHGELRASFLREARLQGVLDHPGIVPVHDVDRDESGRDFLVMKRVLGTTLEEVIRRVRGGDANFAEKFPLRRLLPAYLQVCLTVDYAHSRGVVHRDLKPSNLMLGDYGEAYVLDWGIAKVDGADGFARVPSAWVEPMDSAPTATYLLGTPGYMAPEQIVDASGVDARADVYSLGVVLFTLLTLERLHRGSAFELLESTRRGVDARPTVRAKDKDLPPEYDAICARATAVDPADRYPNVRELHDAVARVLDGDRDMRLRVELAARHLAEADQALSPEGLPGLSQSDASRIALRHAARALALNPQSKAAAALVSTLMLTPPEEVPPEVELETRTLDIEEEARTGWSAAMVGSVLLVMMLALLSWLGVRSWSAVAQMLVPLALAILLGVTAKLRTKPARWPILVGATLIAVGVAGTSRLAGSLWFPPFCALMAVSILSWNHGLGRWRIVTIAIVLSGAGVPWLLEFLGVTTSQYVFRDGGVFVTPDMVAFPQGRIDVAVAFGQVFAVIFTVAGLLRLSRADVDTRRRLQLIAWHLRGLAPSSADDTDITASTAPVAYNPALAPKGRAEAGVVPQPDTAPTHPDTVT